MWYNIFMIKSFVGNVTILLLLLSSFLTIQFYITSNDSVDASQARVLADQITVTTLFPVVDQSLNPNDIFTDVNEARRQQGRTTLIADERLSKLAYDRAQDMVKNQYYAHENKSGQYYYDYLAQYGVNTIYSCENLDLLFVPDVQTAIRDWMTSKSGHRDCMLHDSTTLAGYAAMPMQYQQPNGTISSAYVVVGIHAKP